MDAPKLSELRTPFDLLKEEFISLRAEIAQSITFQHRILIAGYAASGAIVSILVSVWVRFSDDALKNEVWLGLMIVPFVLLAMIALWTVECNRMVRASYYIGEVLWGEMCATVAYERGADWERWIRITDGMAGEFGKTQDDQQRLAVWAVPVILSVFCVFGAFWRGWQLGWEICALVAIASAVQSALFYRLYGRVAAVSRLAGSKLSPIPKKGASEPGGSDAPVDTV